MKPTAATLEPPEPPPECLGFVLQGREPIITPAIQKVKESLARFGYAHSDPGTLSATEVAAAAAKLLVVHGLVAILPTQIRRRAGPHGRRHRDEA
jgi:hypothetical protein